VKICDFCWSASGQPVAAVTQITIGNDAEEVYDACQSCAMSVKELLSQPEEKKKAGRPKKQ
jgi:hypothetical protein